MIDSVGYYKRRRAAWSEETLSSKEIDTGENWARMAAASLINARSRTDSRWLPVPLHIAMQGGLRSSMLKMH